MDAAIAPLPSRAPVTPTAGTGAVAAVLDQLLRDRGALAARITAGRDLASLARALVVIAALSAAVFGAAIGAHRGGIQILYAAIKLPLVLLLSAAIAAPSWSLLRAAFGLPAALVRQLVALLVGLAMIGVVLVGLAPLVLFGVVLGASYHVMAVGLVGCAAIAGGAGLVAVVGAASEPSRSVAPLALFVAVLTLVGAQMSWTLRPYLVRPTSDEVPFVRSIEGSFLEAASESLDSARGRYGAESAP
jgi:hypothetical protein